MTADEKLDYLIANSDRVEAKVDGLSSEVKTLREDFTELKEELTDFRPCMEKEIKPFISFIEEQYASINTKLDMLMAQNEKHEQMFIEFHWLRDTVRQLESKVS